jgi:ribosomal protein L10
MDLVVVHSQRPRGVTMLKQIFPGDLAVAYAPKSVFKGIKEVNNKNILIDYKGVIVNGEILIVISVFSDRKISGAARSSYVLDKDGMGWTWLRPSEIERT